MTKFISFLFDYINELKSFKITDKKIMEEYINESNKIK